MSFEWNKRNGWKLKRFSFRPTKMLWWTFFILQPLDPPSFICTDLINESNTGISSRTHAFGSSFEMKDSKQCLSTLRAETEIILLIPSILDVEGHRVYSLSNHNSGTFEARNKYQFMLTMFCNIILLLRLRYLLMLKGNIIQADWRVRNNGC